MKKILPLIALVLMMICLTVAANAAFGVVVEANKVDEKPNMEEIDESWGEPVLAGITSASENTYLWKYWNETIDTCYGEGPGTGPNGRVTCEPEDLPIDLYLCWDSKYLYFAIDVQDESISGNTNRHRGDGVQLWVQPAEIANPTVGPEDNGADDMIGHEFSYYEYLWTLDSSDWDCHAQNAAESCDYYINPELEGRWQAMIAIPWLNLGYGKGQPTAGTEVAIAFLRVSSRIEVNGIYGLDEGYSGGLCWGKFLADTNTYGKTNESLNTIILQDPANPVDIPTADTTAPETEAPETEAPETTAPETEAPETEAPVVETEAPETEAPVVETEAPETQAPETEAPETEAPETEAPETEAPETEAPETEAPETEAPETEAPETEAPETEAPETEAPETEASDDQPAAPPEDTPVEDMPTPDTPETEAPATEAPETSAPTTPAEPAAEKNNTGLIIGIVAAVVVVGAVVGIVLGKKKK